MCYQYKLVICQDKLLGVDQCHCDVSGLKISTIFVPFAIVIPHATTSADWRLKTPGKYLGVGMEGIVCFHFLDHWSYVCISLIVGR